MRENLRMVIPKSEQKPEAATGESKLAEDAYADQGLWDIDELMRHVPLCRRSIHNLRKKGLPTIVLGRRLFWHPGSVEAWLLRQQRGGEQ